MRPLGLCVDRRLRRRPAIRLAPPSVRALLVIVALERPWRLRPRPTLTRRRRDHPSLAPRPWPERKPTLGPLDTAASARPRPPPPCRVAKLTFRPAPRCTEATHTADQKSESRAERDRTLKWSWRGIRVCASRRGRPRPAKTAVAAARLPLNR